MTLVKKASLPRQFFEAANLAHPTKHVEPLTDAELSRIFGIDLMSLTAEEHAAMACTADGVHIPNENYLTTIRERFPFHTAHMERENILRLRYGDHGVTVFRSDDAQYDHGYAAIFVRPSIQADFKEYLAEACYGYDKKMFKGAQESSPALWQEFHTLLAASKSLGAGFNWSSPYPPALGEPLWKTDARALSAFLKRSGDDADYHQRKIIANQFYATLALITVGNTYSGAYEAQILKRFVEGNTTAAQDAQDLHKAKSSLVGKFGLLVRWGQGSGETQIIMHETFVVPVYRTMKQLLEKGVFNNPYEQEIASDYLTAVETICPKQLGVMAQLLEPRARKMLLTSTKDRLLFK